MKMLLRALPTRRRRHGAFLALLLSATFLPGAARGSATATPGASRPPRVSPGPHPAALEDPVEKARALFDRYVAFEQAYDPAAAELYSDRALIRIRRIAATGEEKVVSLPAPQYKEILRKTMPLAHAGNTPKRYTGTRFLREGDGVRILTTRHAAGKEQGSPVSLLVGPGEDGTWLILEELSVIRQAPVPESHGPAISPSPHPTP